MKDIRDSKIEQLMQAFLLIQTKQECSYFFEDLCTWKEIYAFSQRLDVAKRLMEGHTYEMIEELTGATFNTISRVQKVLQKNPNPFISTILKRIES